jgi:hypothetical protein
VKYALLGVLFMALSIHAGADATVLPVNTVISIPGSLPTTLDDAEFLLTRADMEAAALALETVRIREEQIAKLNATIVETQREFRIMGVGLVVLPILSIVLYALVAK